MALALGCSLVLANCGLPEPDTPPLGDVTAVHITVHGDGLRPIATIGDPAQISAIVAFVDERRSGWETPWYGVPVPSVVAQFCDGKTFKGRFGAGSNFFETNRSCVFCSRSASKKETLAFVKLLKIDERYLDWSFQPPSDANTASPKPIRTSPCEPLAAD